MNFLKKLFFPVIVLMLVTIGYAQKDMTMKEFDAAMAADQKREQVAKEKIAETQTSISLLKDQLNETNKQTEKNHSEMFSLAGTTPEALAQWRERISAFQSQADAIASSAPEEIVRRQADVPAMETQFLQLKEDHAALIPAASVLLGAAESGLNNAKAALTAAQQNIAAAEQAAKQAKIDEAKRKIDEAKQAKLEAKQKAEEERQAKIEAKRQEAETAKQAKLEARQKAEEERQAKIEAKQQAAPAVASGDPGEGLEDLQAGNVYRVKFIIGNRQTLSKMALKLWGDPKQWTRIYELNKEKIDKSFEEYKKNHPGEKFGGPQDYIYPGEDIEIPK